MAEQKHKDNFIITKDEETANKLRNLGFQEIAGGYGDCYTFINNKTLNFESTKLVFSNKLFM